MVEHLMDNPEVILAIIGLFSTALGIFGMWVKRRFDAIDKKRQADIEKAEAEYRAKLDEANNAHEERIKQLNNDHEERIKTVQRDHEIQIERLRNEFTLEYQKLQADRSEKDQLFKMLSQQIVAVEKLASAIEKESQERSREFKEFTTALNQLREVWEIQSGRVVQTETIMRDVGSKAEKATTAFGQLEQRLDSVLDEIKIRIEEFNEGQDSHTEAAILRHTTTIGKLDEIRDMLVSVANAPTKAQNEANREDVGAL